MISIRDQFTDGTSEGTRRIRLSARSLVRAFIIIGQLKPSAVRSELLAAYDGREGQCQDIARLIPVGVEAERPLLASDIEQLTLAERVAFLKGVALLLSKGLRTGEHCLCHMPAAVILPIAAYASLLREDVRLARKSWTDFSSITRLCAEKIRLLGNQAGTRLDLRKLSYDEFIGLLTSGLEGNSVADEAGLARSVAEQFEKDYELCRHRDR